jgi:hypothetical protein
VKEDDMGRACSTNGVEGECIYDVGGKARRKETSRKTKTQVGGILKKILDKIGWYGLDWSGSRWRLVEGSCEHSNDSRGIIKCWEILE